MRISQKNIQKCRIKIDENIHCSNLVSQAAEISYATLRAKQLSKQTIFLFWKAFQEDNLNSVLFFDGEMKTFAEFCSWLMSPDKDVRFVADKWGEIKALYWLNNLLGKSVMIHFCFLRHAFAEQEQIGRYVVEGLLFCRKNSCDNNGLSNQDKQNEFLGEDKLEENKIDKQKNEQNYVLSALIGVTPKCYRHALAYIEKLGFRLKAEVPEACYFARKNAYKTAVFSILTRELYQKAWHDKSI